MVDIKELEQYFDALMLQTQAKGGGHRLADDAQRFEFYKEIKKLFSKVSVNMDCMSENVAKLYPGYVEVLHGLAVNFGEMADITDETMDGYIRTLAVDRLVYNSQGLKVRKETEEQLGYLIQGLMVLFFEEGEDVIKSLESILEDLKAKKSKFFKKKQDDQIKGLISDTMEVYEEIEEDLRHAKEGVIERDKKMVEVLRQLKIKMGGSIIKAAVKHMKSPSNAKPIHVINPKKWQSKLNNRKKTRDL